MCRTGGRRCPAYSDPEKIAARNARRRQAYAAKKGNKKVQNIVDSTTVNHDVKDDVVYGVDAPVQVETDSSGTSFQQDLGEEKHVKAMENIFSHQETGPAVPFSFSVPVSKGATKKVFQQSISLVEDPFLEKMKEYQADELFKIHSEKDYNSRLNVDVQYNSGILVEKDYFNDKTISGQLDYANLTDADDSDLGFREIVVGEDSKNELRFDADKLNKEDFYSLSKAECVSLEENEEKSLTYFTSNNYKWMNNALFSKRIRKGDPQELEGVSFVDVTKQTYYPKGENTEVLKRITSELDKALEKGPKQQRTLYRGVGSHAKFLTDENGKQISVSEWVDKNLSVGGEIVFDGYQSSSPRPENGLAHASDKGIVYEIITPEGINVESVTDFKGENEVILPRESRYAVASIIKNVNMSLHRGSSVKDVTVVRLIAINSKGEILDGTNSDKKEPITDDYFKETFE